MTPREYTEIMAQVDTLRDAAWHLGKAIAQGPPGSHATADQHTATMHAAQDAIEVALDRHVIKPIEATAAEKYHETKRRIMTKLDDIRDKVVILHQTTSGAPIPEDQINWGHVGDLTTIEGLLAPIFETFDGWEGDERR